MKKLLIVLFTPILLWSCGSEETASGGEQEGVVQDTTEEVVADTVKLDQQDQTAADLNIEFDLNDSSKIIRFVCNSVMNEETMVPTTTVKFSLGEELIDVKTVVDASPYAPEMYQTKDIPDTAIAACGGWFAGGGDYFFAVKKGDSDIIIYSGWQDEGQEEPGFHYEPYINIAFGEKETEITKLKNEGE